MNSDSTEGCYLGEQDNSEGFCGLRSGGRLCPAGLEKGVTLTLQRYVIGSCK